MPSKDRDTDREERPSERRHRAKSEKDPNRPHKPSRTSRPKTTDSATGQSVKSPHRRRKDKERESKDKDNDKEEGLESSPSMADLVPELSRTASAPGAMSRSSLPYPSFNKAYSKEAVNSREDVRIPTKAKTNVPTPESTDLSSENKKSQSAENLADRNDNTKNGRPPTPPDTDFSRPKKDAPTRTSELKEDIAPEARPSSRTSRLGMRKDKDEKSKVSVKSQGSKASTDIKSKPAKKVVVDGNHSEVSQGQDVKSEADSNATFVAPEWNPVEPGAKRRSFVDTDSSSVQDSSPRTPIQAPQFPPSSAADSKRFIPPFLPFQAPQTNSTPYSSPQPPPPPPPPAVPLNIPRVDYLMQNGGLSRPVPKTLLAASPAYSQQVGSRSDTPAHSDVDKVFGPYFNVLDQYEMVINRNGSIAVATGYRSVARRLLDRLENVFERDLPSKGCSCVMCLNSDMDVREGSRGLGWGEVLEWVSQRRELPVWPAFDFATLGVKTADDIAGLGISRSGSDPTRPRSPIKIDPDIADEFREHYLQQSKKTKIAVSKWLSSTPQNAPAPPQEVDDETLSFAIVTHLDQYDRSIFNALMTGSTILQPVSRAPTPIRKPRSESMTKAIHSVQRLYRLPVPPRDPEVAIYLLKNPHIHNLLTTLACISAGEWEILISGRFDGFLWSGADPDDANLSPAPSRGPTPLSASSHRSPMSPAMRQAGNSRANTPFSPLRSASLSSPADGQGYASRGPTPSQRRHPVSNDEETEIAVLAEIEREIYLGMEALEDAFEGLHRKAETVRQALRERGAGLSMSLQARRTSQPETINPGTPAPYLAGSGPGYERPNWGEGDDMDSQSDWDPGDEMQSELAPDDSASNISSSRHRRPKRRNERRTPALVEEEDED
ncbi:hypothetical protein B7494_g5511 [Chlorociboria aeruginascens]|nr:hypothetical protein B7494_g5511 [Chlorociboria aeruginascens]